MSLPNPKTRNQKPGLWLPTVHVEVQTAKKSHKMTCFACGGKPKRLRLMVKIGSGRGGKARVYCECDAHEFVMRRIAEGHRLLQCLLGNATAIRDPEKTVHDPSWNPSRAGAKVREPKPPKRPTRPLPDYMRGLLKRTA